MTYVIDCRLLNASGIGVYLRGIMPWLLKSNNQFILIGNAGQLQLFTSYANVSIINCSIKTFSLNELLFFPFSILKQINKAAFYFTPYFNIPYGIKIPVFTTIHDMIFPDMPECTSKIGLIIRMWFFRRAYKKSKKIFTVSEFSKARIEYHLGIKKPIIVTYSAIQQMFLNYHDNKKGNQKKETIIFIGNIKKHKGLSILLESFNLVKKEGLPHSLVIIGSKENLRSSDKSIINRIEELGSYSVSFTGFISDTQLMEYIAESALLVQPSLYEGFCLPPLEAMFLGTKALISDIPVLKEVYSRFPVTYFKSGNVLDLKNKLIEILHNKEAPYIKLSENLINKYTFQKTASILLNNFN